MATSGITTTTYNANQIIAAAIRKLCPDGSGNYESWEYENGKIALNLIAWQLRKDHTGFKMWARKRSTLTLTAKNNFTIKTSSGDLNTGIPISIITAMLKDTSGNETPLTPMLVEEYQAIGNKTATGDPSRFYYEKQLDAGYFYLDCVPSNITKTIVITHLRPIEDFNAGVDTPDFPQEWYRALVALLRIDLAPEYSKPVTQDMVLMAQQAVAMAESFSPENCDVFFQPEIDE